jgi:hypothetical protein
MAIADALPVYNEINYVCSSTNVAQPGFKYLVDIYIGAIKVARRRVSAEPINNKLIVNVATIIENYVTNNPGVYPDNDEGINSGANQFIAFTVKFGEEYLVATVRTQYPDLTVSNTANAFNGAVDYSTWLTWSGTYTGRLTSKPLTSNTSGYYGSGYTSIIIGSAVTLTSYTVATYSGGVLQNTYVIPNVLSEKLHHLATGYDAINKILSAKITGAPVQPILTTAIDRYDVHYTTSAGATTPIVYTLIDRCEENESDRLHFLNHLGGFDTFDFTLLGTKNASIDKKSMQRSVERLDSSGVYATSSMDKGLTNYNSTFERTDKLVSDWITEAESDWLIDLLASPSVILERGGVFSSIVVTDTAYDFKTEQQDQLFKIEVTIKHSLKEIRQRG